MKKSILFSGLLAVSGVCAQTTQNDSKLPVITCSEFHITKPLSELFAENQIEADFISKDKKEFQDRKNRKPHAILFNDADSDQDREETTVQQTIMGDRQQQAPLVNWLGQDGNGSYPPDPSGAAGPDNYVQLVNSTTFKVYSKTGVTQLTGSLGSLWSPATGDAGDPIVMYDKYADRWFLSQFSDIGNEIYIAISQTNDPTGAYYAYTFTSPEFPDYLKFSIWADGYYMTSNQTPKVFCFERDQMLIGNAASRSVYSLYTPPPLGPEMYCALPGDADGQLPPAGTPCPFFAFSDDAWGGGNIDAILIYKMAVVWGATPSATISTDGTVPLSAFDSSSDPNWDDISQPGTTDKLDGLGSLLTYRAPWRKWVGYNSVVLNFSIKLSATQHSIRWCELRQNQGTGIWSLMQEGTYTPDSHSRWLGSIAMDDNGSIALCYAKSSTSVSPSLCYTGRLASDPLGTMTFAEQTAIAGSGAQTGVNRFGDYSQTSLDPDGITFWHTGEYVLSGNPATRIYSFQLPAGSVGVDNIQNQPVFTVFQSENKLIFKAEKLHSNEEFVVDLFDITGKQINGKKITPVLYKFDTTIDVSGLAKGAYLVRVGNNSFQRVVKAFVN